jgi:catechol 2,3-dioxygenase-like lactoylglutathione lyase family enzyme
MPLQLTKIGVVMLGTKDLARSLKFYRDTLGMAVQSESPNFAFLNAGGVTLALASPLAAAAEHMVGATEVVFSVDSVQAAYEELKRRGVAFVNEPRVVAPPMWAVNFKDPDGHGLSLFGQP